MMKPYFNRAKLLAVLKDYYNITNIRIAFLDNNYSDVEGYPKERAEICNYIRSSAEADKQCHQCDKRACEESRKSGQAYMYRCHAGLYEIIDPLIVNNIVIGYLFFAHMISGPDYETASKEIIECTKKYNLDPKILNKLVRNSPLLNQEYIKSSERLLDIVTTHLCMEQMGFLKNSNSFPFLINKYIHEHIDQEIAIKDLCSLLGVCKTKLCQISQEFFECGIHQHIRNIRIEKAKSLLIKNPDISLDDVASECGFSDYNYFIQIFRKIVGTTPKKYAAKNKGLNNTSNFILSDSVQ